MDFRFTEEQDALRELAREILEQEVTVERLKEIEKQGDFFDRATWSALAEANLLGLAIPEAQGGMGMGFLELCVLLAEIGRTVAPLPAVPALVLGGLAVAQFGSDAQKERWLAPLAKGDAILSAALAENAEVTASRSGDTVTLEGRCGQVPAAAAAQRVFVPAEIDGQQAYVAIDPNGAGVSLEARQTSRSEPYYEITLSGASAPADDALVADGLHEWVGQRALVAAAATQVGVSERAIEITVAYLTEREQFGAPLGALPPVQHRAADCFVALDSLRWVMWQTAWKLAEGREATRDVWVTKYWTAEAGSKIGTSTQHLHGGMGVDMDYPIHRYFLWAKQLELTGGAATPTLAKLGADMARTGPQELS